MALKKYGKKKTLKVKRSMLKKGKAKKAYKSKKAIKKSPKKGGAVAFPSRYYGASWDTKGLLENPNKTTGAPLAANETWNSFGNVGPGPSCAGTPFKLES